MQREIKFRAWDKEEEKMWNSNNILVGDGIFLYGGHTYEPEIYSYTKRNDFIPMQFTGLLDKNGTEIYEGDICKWPSNINREIVWDERNACFSSRDVMLQAEIGKIAILGHHLEIIGNIYENPELLTK